MKNKSGMAAELHRAKVDADRERLARRAVDKALQEAVKERDELQQSFDLLHAADMRGIKLWRSAHPEKELVWPDRGQMIFWLLEQLAERQERAEHWENEAHTLGHIEYAQRETIKRLENRLAEFINHVEEQNVLLAEVYVAHGFNPQILDELCEKKTSHDLREFCRMYESKAAAARVELGIKKESGAIGV